MAIAAEAIDANRSIDVLKVLKSGIHIFSFNTFLDLSERIFGKAYAARLSYGFDPRSNIHPIAEDIIGLNDHIADIKSDPKLDFLVRRKCSIPCLHACLKFNRTARRIDNTCKFCQQTIAGSFYNSPLVVRDARFDQFAEVGSHAGKCAFLVPTH